MSKTTILQGPDGRLYEIPDHVLAGFAVPGDRVAELRRRLAQGQQAAGAFAGAAGPSPAPSSDPHPGAGAALPPGHAALPSGHAAAPPASLNMSAGGGVVLNFYFQAPPGAGAGAAQAPPSDLGVDGYHMTFDENGIPVNHTEMLWGDYIDKQGNPAVGWHSHDPVTGNAQ